MDQDWQLEESKRIKHGFKKFGAALIGAGIIGAIYAIFISDAHVEKVVFATGLAIYFAWDGVQKKF